MPIRFYRINDRRQPDVNSLTLMNWQLATGSQMSIRFQRILDNMRLIVNRQMAVRFQFAHSYELATGNGQSNANSISEDLRQF